MLKLETKSLTNDALDVSNHFPYCKNHPEETGLILKASKLALDHYDTAEAFCKEDGMELVVVRTREELDKIADLMEGPEGPGVFTHFYLNGHMIGNSHKRTHPCGGLACGADVIQWTDPGGLPFDSTLYGDTWLRPTPGNNIKPCLQLKVFASKKETIHGVNCNVAKHAVCMARCGGYLPCTYRN